MFSSTSSTFRPWHACLLLVPQLLWLWATVAPAAPVIRQIQFERDPIWVEQDYERFPDLLLNSMNFIHIDTSEDFLRRELTFSVGDTLSQAAFAESERRIRALRFLREVSITPHAADEDSVDVIVHTRETWTTSLGIRLESFQGDTFIGFSLTERNFLGMGRRLGLRWDSTPDRSGWTLDYAHPHLMGTRNDFSLLVQDNSDGSRLFIELARPWTSLDAPWRYQANYGSSGERPRYSLNRTEYVRSFLDDQEANLRVKWRLGGSMNRVYRAGPMVQWEKLEFREESGLAVETTQGSTGQTVDFPPDAPENRERLTLGVASELRSHRYGVFQHIELMGRNEDFPLGNEVFFDLGWNAEGIAGDVSGLYMYWSHTFNTSTGPVLHRWRSEGSGMIEDGRGRNLRLVLDYELNWALRPGWRFAADAVGGWGERLDSQRPFVMGSESGLRSALYKEFTGDRYLRSNFELRWTLERGIWDLLVPGLAAFADFGSVWYTDDQRFEWDQVNGALGIGLRLATSTSTAGLPIRMDLAWPVGARTGAGSPVFSLGTGQAF